MPRDTSLDTLWGDLIDRIVLIEQQLTLVATRTDTSAKAAYPNLNLPMPAGPWPAIYNYIAGIQPDYTGGASIRTDIITVIARCIGGPITPGYQFNPEDMALNVANSLINELDYRPFLQKPSDGTTFKYLAPMGVNVKLLGRNSQIFDYGGDQGKFIGVEVSITAPIKINVARIG